jgi:FixJ family two-component response regulator
MVVADVPSRLRKPLSPRESEIVEMIYDELETREIAQILRISANTVNAHVQRIALKLPPGEGPPLRRIRRWRRRQEKEKLTQTSPA